MEKLLDKKVDFCLTPLVRSSARLAKNTQIIQSTPFNRDGGKSPSKPRFLLIDEDSIIANPTYQLTPVINLTSNSTAQVSTKERSLYPHQNVNQMERICLEFDYLRLKLQNQKCERQLEESNKAVEKSIRTATELQRKKEDEIVKMCSTLERKMQLSELIERSEQVLMHMNAILPDEALDELGDQLARYKAILEPALDTFKLVNFENGNCVNELFEMMNREDFCEIVNANNELAERMKVLDAEKSKWRQTTARLKPLSEESERLAVLVQCLSKKGAL